MDLEEYHEKLMSSYQDFFYIDKSDRFCDFAWNLEETHVVSVPQEAKVSIFISIHSRCCQCNIQAVSFMTV